MFRHRRLLQTQPGNNISHRSLGVGQVVQDLPPPRLGHCVEGVGGCGRAWHERNIYSYIGMCQLTCENLASVIKKVSLTRPDLCGTATGCSSRNSCVAATGGARHLVINAGNLLGNSEKRSPHLAKRFVQRMRRLIQSSSPAIRRKFCCTTSLAFSMDHPRNSASFCTTDRMIEGLPKSPVSQR
jgi:hypothetical protein